jgi:non-ribosomal peptide synthetase component F
VAWWQQRLTDAPRPIELPFRRPVRLQGIPPKEGVIRLDVADAVSDRLDHIARERHATFFVARLAAFVALLAAETGQPDIMLGTYVTNRNRIATQKMFGDFSNLLALRFHADDRLTFREWISMVGVVAGEFQAHGEIPYEQLCEELRQRSTNPPEIHAIFAIQNASASAIFGGLEFARLSLRRHKMPWGFTFCFGPAQCCHARFDADLYDPAGVRRFIDRLLGFLESATLHPDWPLSRLLADPATDQHLEGNLSGGAAVCSTSS